MKISSALTPFLFFTVVMVLWEVLVVLLEVPAYLLPAPTEIIAAINSELFMHLAVTAGEAIAGFAIGSICAFIAALIFVRSPFLERGLFPLAIALKTTPLVAIAPLLVLWMGTGWWSKISAAAIICFFPVLVNTVKGLKAADSEYFDMFASFGASDRQVFHKLRIPFCMPYLFSALKISSSLAIVGAVVGEFVGATHGIGYVIMVSSSHLDTDILFSAIFAAASLGIVLFQVIGWIELRLIFWSAPAIE
jgi:NitT/TauT family transport system permease protein